MTETKYTAIDRDELRRLQADSLELERIRNAPAGEVEAVAWQVLSRNTKKVRLYRGAKGYLMDGFRNAGYETEPLITVAQHQRIVAGLEAEIARLRQHKNDYMEAAEQTARALRNEINDHQEEIRRLDAVASKLRAQLAAPQAAVPVEWCDKQHLLSVIRDVVGTNRMRVEHPTDQVAAEAIYQAISEHLPIYEDVYDQLSEMIEPHVSRLHQPDGWLPASVVDSVRLLLEQAVESRAARSAPQQGAMTVNELASYAADKLIEVAQQGVVMPDARTVITDTLGFEFAQNELQTVNANDLLRLVESARLNADRSAQTDAARDVLAERRRQVEAEDFDASHDDMATRGQLSMAAACYTFEASRACHWSYGMRDVAARPLPAGWPWDSSWWKPAEPRRMLVKAGALILAEIERLDRSAQGEKP